MKHRIHEISWKPSLTNNQIAKDTCAKLQLVWSDLVTSHKGEWSWDRDHEDQHIVFWYESDDQTLEDPKVRELIAALVHLVLVQVTQPFIAAASNPRLEWYGEAINDPRYHGLIKRSHWGNDSHPRAPRMGDTAQLAGLTRTVVITEVVGVRPDAWKINWNGSR